MIKTIRKAIARRYYPADRWRMIAADLIMLIFFSFAIPSAFIVWRMLWRAALAC